MQQISHGDFLVFLAEALMYEEGDLAMDKAFPELVYDSTGMLMLAAALEDRFGEIVSLDDLVECHTPGDIYELLMRKS